MLDVDSPSRKRLKAVLVAKAEHRREILDAIANVHISSGYQYDPIDQEGVEELAVGGDLWVKQLNFNN